MLTQFLRFNQCNKLNVLLFMAPFLISHEFTRIEVDAINVIIIHTVYDNLILMKMEMGR